MHKKAAYAFVYNKDMEVIYLYLNHVMYRVPCPFSLWQYISGKISEILNFWTELA